MHTFEPEAENLKLLRANVERNGLAGRVVVVPKAVKATSGTTQFFSTPMMGGGMQTTMETFANSFQHERVADVPCVSLTDHFAEHGIKRVRLCKIDCEGAELEIVRSLTAENAARIDAFVLEFHPQAYALKDLVAALETFDRYQLMFAPPKYCERQILWAISRETFREIAAGIV